MTELLHDLKSGAAFRAVKERVEVALHHSAELTWEDELELARQADEERGYDLPLDVRSKRMHDLADGAPVTPYRARRTF